MKATDIKPGLAVMVPAGDVKWGEVRNGRRGVPAVVLAFGNFRLTQQGPCGYIAVDNPRDWEKPKVVVLRQAGHFFWRNDPVKPNLITPDTEWQLDLVSQYQLVPVAGWETLNAEYELLVLDLDALQTQQRSLSTERDAVISNDPNLAEAIMAVVRGRRDQNEYCRINPFRYNGDDATMVDFSGRVGLNELTFETRERVAVLDEQLAKILAKLTCLI